MHRPALIGALALLLSATGASAQSEPVAPAPAGVIAPDPDALGVARDIVEKGFPPARRRAMFAGAMDSVMEMLRGQQGPGMDDPGMRAIIDRYVASTRESALASVDQHAASIFEAIARAYAREFSIDELRHIRDFASTPAGQHFLSRSSAVLQDPDVMAANKAFVGDVMTITKDRQSALVQEIAAYLRLHPEIARKINAQGK